MRFLLCAIVCMVFGWIHAGAVFAEERLVAVILTRDIPRYQTVHDAFVKDFEQPNNVRLLVLRPDGDTMSLRECARQAMARGVDVFLTYGVDATAAALAESHATPVFYADVIDPITHGFIPDHHVPGEHVTGVRGDAPAQTLLKHFQAATNASCVCVLFDDDTQSSGSQAEAIRRLAERKGLNVVPRPFRPDMDVARILATVPGNSQGIYFAESHTSFRNADILVEEAMKRGLPVISQMPGLAEKGALMVLESDPGEQGGYLAAYLERYLGGTPLADLQPEHPREVSLVVNLKSAQRLGIDVPFDVLAVTSRVIR